MMFAYPWMFLLLLLIPAVVGWMAFRKRRHGHTPTLRFANFTAVRRVGTGWKNRLWWVPDTLRGLGVVALVVALARPQTEDVEVLLGKGLDIMIALDMSGSMNDIDRTEAEIAQYHMRGEEVPNRFAVAIETLKEFLKSRQGDRIGLVVFSTEAYLKFPLTLDYKTVFQQLEGLVLDSMERQEGKLGCVNNCTITGERTAVGDALAKAYKRLEKSDGKGKVIVLITDGNDNASKLKPMDVAKYLGEQPEASRPRLYTFLIGTGKETKRPAMMGGRLVKLQGLTQYMPNDEPIDEAKIKEITTAAQGVFHATYDEEEFRKAFESLEKSERVEQRLARHKDLFMPVLLLALGLFLMEFLLRNTLFRRMP